MQVQRIVINRKVFRVVVLVATLTVAATGFTAEANRVADAAERNESDVVRVLMLRAPNRMVLQHCTGLPTGIRCRWLST